MSSPLGLEGKGGEILEFWSVGGVGKFSGYRGGSKMVERKTMQEGVCKF